MFKTYTPVGILQELLKNVLKILKHSDQWLSDFHKLQIIDIVKNERVRARNYYKQQLPIITSKYYYKFQGQEIVKSSR